jgi:hypothetical protein
MSSLSVLDQVSLAVATPLTVFSPQNKANRAQHHLQQRRGLQQLTQNRLSAAYIDNLPLQMRHNGPLLHCIQRMCWNEIRIVLLLKVEQYRITTNATEEASKQVV